MNPTIEALFDENTSTVSYLVSDPNSRHAVIIDPVLDFDPKSARLNALGASAPRCGQEQNLSVESILETHAHADHLWWGIALRKLGWRFKKMASISEAAS